MRRCGCAWCLATRYLNEEDDDDVLALEAAAQMAKASGKKAPGHVALLTESEEGAKRKHVKRGVIAK